MSVIESWSGGNLSLIPSNKASNTRAFLDIVGLSCLVVPSNCSTSFILLDSLRLYSIPEIKISYN
jgi:hypothetical protein